MDVTPGDSNVTLITGVAHSQSEDLSKACIEAVDAAIADAGDGVTAVLCLPCASYGSEPVPAALSDLRKHVDAGIQIGGSCIGGFAYGDAVVDGFLGGKKGVLAIAFAGAKHTFAFAGDVRADGEKAAKAAAAALSDGLGGKTPGACLLFVPGFPGDSGVSSNNFVGALAAALPGVTVTGGGACCGMTVEGELVPGHCFVDDKTSDDAALVFALDAPASTGFANAIAEVKKLGPGGGVAGPMLSTLGGEPAADAFRNAFHENDRALLDNNAMIGGMELGVGLATYDAATDTYWPNGIAAFTPDSALIALPATIKDGDEMLAVRVSPELVLKAVETTGQKLSREAGDSPVELVLAHSCAMRDFHLKERATEEQRILGEQVPGSKVVKILAIGEVASSVSEQPTHRFTSYAFSAIGWGR